MVYMDNWITDFHANFCSLKTDVSKNLRFGSVAVKSAKIYTFYADFDPISCILFFPRYHVTSSVFFTLYNVYRVILIRWCPVHPVSLFAGNTSSLPSCHLFFILVLSLFFVSPLSILSSFSLVTHPAYHLVIFFILSPFFSFLTCSSCHPFRW